MLESLKSNGAVKEEPKKISTHDRLVTGIRDELEKGSKSPIELVKFAKSLTGSPQEVMDALFEALFDNWIGKGFAKEVTKKKKYIVAAVREGDAQILLLHAVEAFCNKCNGDVVKEVALAIKTLYDVDVLEEEFIVEWYQQGISGATTNSQIWKNMKPFIEWLESAESEED